MTDRLVSPQSNREENLFETTLRHQRMTEFIGQPKVKEKIKISVEAARRRGEALDHVLLSGPPGLGKTTLAAIIARELEVNFKSTSGPVLERKDQLAAILTELRPRDVLFIDEIHRLIRVVEECLYPAMEDYRIDVLLGEGPHAKTVVIPLKPFTLIGATTRSGMLTSPLRDRFGINARFDFYDEEDVARVIERSARILGVEIEPEGIREIARRARRTPRVANRLLKLVRDYAEIKADGRVTTEVAQGALALWEVDENGLDAMDRAILENLVHKFGGGPVGLKTLAVAVSEDPDTIEDVYEPFLIRIGFLNRTPSGRVATERGFRYLGVQPSSPKSGELLF
jgi:Holliday junction DNA helicase RuvB